VCLPPNGNSIFDVTKAKIFFMTGSIIIIRTNTLATRFLENSWESLEGRNGGC
jgi:hypothetical protein